MIPKEKTHWKRYLKEILLGIAVVFIFSNIINYIRAPKLESDQLSLPSVALLDGTPYKVPKDRPVVLHFWGTWCPVCRTEASTIDRLAKSYDVVTVAVNSGSSKEVQAYMQKHKLHYHVINDPEGKLAAQYRVNVFPTTFIFDASGKLRFTETGYTTTAGFFARMNML